jgi:hypothetical protein
MQHYAFHARRGLWLFHDWEEARALWDRLVAVTTVHHLCLLPDRVHLLSPHLEPGPLRAAMSGHSRWLGHRWTWPGMRLWQPLPPPTLIHDPTQLERTCQGVLFAPSRAALVDDPMSWAFSTLRDAEGLAWPPARVPTTPPALPEAHRTASFDDVLRAVSAVSRTPVPRLTRRGGSRHRLIYCLRQLTDLSTRALGAPLELTHSAVVRVPAGPEAMLWAVARALGDPRFAALEPGDLRTTPMWQRYRSVGRSMFASSKTSVNSRRPSQAP